MNDELLRSIDSRAGFESALVASLGWAAARGARRLWLADPDFASWPLEDERWLDPLTAWVRQPTRRLTLLARGFDELQRRHPRFVAWRRTWAHAVEAFEPAEPGLEVPALLVDDGPVLLELVDRSRFRGRAHRQDPRAARAWRDELDALLQRSQPSFSPTVLGL